MDNDFLIELTKRKCNQAWIGTRPPFGFHVIDLLNSTNYRVSPSQHQNYKIVWLYEHCLNDLKTSGWKIVLDEAIRLLNEEGLLVVRSSESKKLTTPMIKNYIGRHIGIEAYIEYEVQEKSTNTWTFVFRINRKNIEFYKNKEWTFAILTSGKKVDNVIEFLKSIRTFDKNCVHEIIIAGPQNVEYDKFKVSYLDMSEFRDEQYAEISKKKNVIANKATKANIMVIHDRFRLDENFFLGFEKYGYDFDFLTVKQYYESGSEFPSYCATRNVLHWGAPIKVDNYNQLYDGQYLNGGLLIFKTHILKRLKFNSLLMWNQMEDAEIAKCAVDNSIIPRINFLSSATTLGIDETYTNTFLKEIKGVSINPLNMQLDTSIPLTSKKLNMYMRISRFIPKRIKTSLLYEKIKQRLLKHI